MAFIDELRETLHRAPDEIIMDFAGRFFSRGEVAALAGRIGTLLDEAGVPIDASIGIIMRNRPLHVAAVLGLITGGRPLTSIYALQSPALLARDIAETRFAAIIADVADLSSEAIEAVRHCGGVAIALDLATESAITRHPACAHFIEQGAYHRIDGEPGLELLSSGTTGKPKRIRFPFRMLVRSVETVSAGVSAGAVPPDICTWSFAGIAMGNIAANIMIGRYMALIDRFNVPEWIEAVRRLRPAYVTGPPAVAQMIVDADVAVEDLASISYFYGGSAPMPVELQRKLLDRYDIAVIWAYGATEFCGTIVSWSLDLYREFGATKMGSMGVPLPGVQVRIVDQVTGEPLPRDAIGFLEAIVPAVGDGWIRTSDLATIDADGFIFHRGRGDGAIMRGGFKILPETIAAALAKHPAVLDSGVAGIADSRLGQVPVAAVQLRSGADAISAQALRDFLREELPATYIPGQIRIVPSLPRTASMKVDLGAVRALFSESADAA